MAKSRRRRRGAHARAQAGQDLTGIAASRSGAGAGRHQGGREHARNVLQKELAQLVDTPEQAGDIHAALKRLFTLSADVSFGSLFLEEHGHVAVTRLLRTTDTRHVREACLLLINAVMDGSSVALDALVNDCVFDAVNEALGKALEDMANGEKGEGIVDVTVSILLAVLDAVAEGEGDNTVSAPQLSEHVAAAVRAVGTLKADAQWNVASLFQHLVIDGGEACVTLANDSAAMSALVQDERVDAATACKLALVSVLAEGLTELPPRVRAQCDAVVDAVERFEAVVPVLASYHHDRGVVGSEAGGIFVPTALTTFMRTCEAQHDAVLASQLLGGESIIEVRGADAAEAGMSAWLEKFGDVGEPYVSALRTLLYVCSGQQDDEEEEEKEKEE